MKRDELLKTFREIASKVAEKDLPAMSESTAIADLGIDSLGLLEIIGDLERELNIRIPDDQLVGISTVSQLVDLVQKRVQPSA